ncbi:MAG: energy transducer TonB, partial [Marinilabiliales bacterium]
MNLFKKNRNGILGTIAFHIVLAVILLVSGFTTPLPLPGEESILVNFGTDDMGSGMVQPERVESTPAPEKTQEENVNEEVLTQDFEEAPYVESSERKEVVESDEVVETQDKEVEERVVNPDLLFNNERYNNNSTGEGPDNEGTDKGKEEGDINATSYEGSNIPGSGISYSLTGRKPQALIKPKYNCDESGKVVVEIKVDKFGRVETAAPGYKGTTTHA